MKTIAKITLALAFCIPVAVQANTITLKADTSKFVKDVKKGAKKVGHKTAEIAVKGTSAIVDKIYKDKQGPNGETIYINKHDRCYYVNAKGGKVYIKKTALRNKPIEH